MRGLGLELKNEIQSSQSSQRKSEISNKVRPISIGFMFQPKP
jgi:hypothetical protein